MPSFPFDPKGPLAAIVRHYAWTVPIVALLALVGSLLEGVGIGLLIPLLATLIAGERVALGAPLDTVTQFADRFQPDVRLSALAAAILAMIVLKNIVFYVYSVFVAEVDGRASHRIRSAVSQRLLQIGYPFFLGEDPSRLVNVIATESWRASDAIRAVFSAVASVGSVAVFAALLLLIEWRLFAAVAAGTLLIRLLHTRMVNGLRIVSRAVSEANRGLADRMMIGVVGMRVVRVFGQEAREQERFEAASEEVRRRMFELDRRSAGVAPVQEVLHTCFFVAILLGATLLNSGITLPVLAAFLVLLQRMQPHLRSLESARVTLASSEGSVREVEWLLDPAGKPAPPAGTLPFDTLAGSIEFEGVSFSFSNRPGAEPALIDASFRIAAGSATAILGASGSGKSTIVNLLCRLLEPDRGSIRIDGVDLGEINPAAWRRRISLAGQDIELTDGTIAENIAYGAPGLSEADIAEAARLADADRFIRYLPEGYDTTVGSRGLSLSGGQRQRIGLARAFARKPELLILDEATNAVDSLSEATIMSLVRASSKRLTILVVSHRASTLAVCDAGVVLSAGRVVESGPLTELVAFRQMRAASLV